MRGTLCRQEAVGLPASLSDRVAVSHPYAQPVGTLGPRLLTTLRPSTYGFPFG